jgi:hemerythrin superfamily protein
MGGSALTNAGGVVTEQSKASGSQRAESNVKGTVNRSNYLDTSANELHSFLSARRRYHMPKQSQNKKTASGAQKASVYKGPDALEILKADHETVRSLFRRHSSASLEEQTSLAKQIFNELDMHSTVEEELFYPALSEQGDVKELAELEGEETVDLSEEDNDSEREGDGEAVAEQETKEEEGQDLITLAYEDHKAVKNLIQELRKLNPSSDPYRSRFDELREAVMDHIEEEEEVLFAEAKLKLDIKEIGAAIAKRRSDLAASMAA